MSHPLTITTTTTLPNESCQPRNTTLFSSLPQTEDSYSRCSGDARANDSDLSDRYSRQGRSRSASRSMSGSGSGSGSSDSIDRYNFNEIRKGTAEQGEKRNSYLEEQRATETNGESSSDEDTFSLPSSNEQLDMFNHEYYATLSDRSVLDI